MYTFIDCLGHLTLNLVQRQIQLVELKSGDTFNGHLVNCDSFMNITLREVYQTSADADRFWKLKECYIRGSTVSVRFLLYHFRLRVLLS